MQLTTIEIIYLVAFFLGTGFAVLSGLLSGVFGADSHGVGGTEVHGGHIQMGHHDLGQGDNVSLSPLSPVTLAMFVTCFGGTGFTLSKWAHLPLSIHLPVSLISGFVIAAALFALFVKIMSVTQATSVPTGDEMIGVGAEVITHIPAEGLGEIAYTLRGSRLNAPGRTIDGKELPQGAPVTIVRVEGTTYIVEKVR
jgi:membrane protein implicated in regulation of membrane protease activity